MDRIVRLTGPNRAVEILGVKLVGVNADNGKKLLFSIAFILLVLLLSAAIKRLARTVLRRRRDLRIEFWSRQGIQLAAALVLILGIVSIWFDDPTRLTTALGLFSAGVAFALQKVITSLAGYFVILRGRTFNVGDRIVMGGVRGDVIALGFMQTTILEMGEPPAVQAAEPAMWVRSRQYTGRVVTVTNDKIFQEPVFNYTRDFPYIWEEMMLPVAYGSDRRRAEQILLDVAQRHTLRIQDLSKEVAEELERRYFVTLDELAPRVYYRLTDNWLELTVRFVTHTHRVRNLKDAMSREVLDALDEAGIGIASTTVDIVGLPALKIERPQGR